MNYISRIEKEQSQMNLKVELIVTTLVPTNTRLDSTLFEHTLLRYLHQTYSQNSLLLCHCILPVSVSRQCRHSSLILTSNTLYDLPSQAPAYSDLTVHSSFVRVSVVDRVRSVSLLSPLASANSSTLHSKIFVASDLLSIRLQLLEVVGGDGTHMVECVIMPPHREHFLFHPRRLDGLGEAAGTVVTSPIHHHHPSNNIREIQIHNLSTTIISNHKCIHKEQQTRTPRSTQSFPGLLQRSWRTQ